MQSLPRRSRTVTSLVQFATRMFYLHEYQAFNLINSYRIPTPALSLACNADEAYAVARKYPKTYNRGYVVKAQVQVTGRSKGFFRENGLASGIHRVNNAEAVKAITAQMSGKHLINTNTPRKGLICRSVLIMEEVLFSSKHFLSLTFDRKLSCPVLTYSKMGGHPLDRLLNMFPDAVHQHPIDIAKGIDTDIALHIADTFGCPD